MRFFIIFMLVLTFLPAQAKTTNKLSSQYSTLKLKDCKLEQRFENNMGSSFMCPGLGDYKIYLAEGDLRFFIGYGKNAKTTHSASQTLSPFNTIFSDNNNQATIEWRVEKKKGKWQPFATILRYYTGSEGSAKGQTLIVTKISENESCHVAHINAHTKNANILARRIADSFAQRFDCKREPMIYQ